MNFPHVTATLVATILVAGCQLTTPTAKDPLGIIKRTEVVKPVTNYSKTFIVPGRAIDTKNYAYGLMFSIDERSTDMVQIGEKEFAVTVDRARGEAQYSSDSWAPHVYRIKASAKKAGSNYRVTFTPYEMVDYLMWKGDKEKASDFRELERMLSQPSYEFERELASQFPPKAIIAAFKRSKLAYKNSSRDNQFTVVVPEESSQGSASIWVSVEPYKNGSKVLITGNPISLNYKKSVGKPVVNLVEREKEVLRYVRQAMNS